MSRFIADSIELPFYLAVTAIQFLICGDVRQFFTVRSERWPNWFAMVHHKENRAKFDCQFGAASVWLLQTCFLFVPTYLFMLFREWTCLLSQDVCTGWPELLATAFDQIFALKSPRNSSWQLCIFYDEASDFAQTCASSLGLRLDCRPVGGQTGFGKSERPTR